MISHNRGGGLITAGWVIIYNITMSLTREKAFYNPYYLSSYWKVEKYKLVKGDSGCSSFSSWRQIFLLSGGFIFQAFIHPEHFACCLMNCQLMMKSCLSRYLLKEENAEWIIYVRGF